MELRGDQAAPAGNHHDGQQRNDRWKPVRWIHGCTYAFDGTASEVGKGGGALAWPPLGQSVFFLLVKSVS